MIGRLLGLLMLVAAVAAPAHAQTSGEVCQALTREFGAASVAVSKQAADVPGALAARSELAPKEAAAREACGPGGYRWTVPIDMMKEDLDITLGRAVPACNAVINAAAPHVSGAMQIRTFTDKTQFSIDELVRIRGEAAEPCKDYPGVMGRMYRVELQLISYLPPPK